MNLEVRSPVSAIYVPLWNEEVELYCLKGPFWCPRILQNPCISIMELQILLLRREWGENGQGETWEGVEWAKWQSELLLCAHSQSFGVAAKPTPNYFPWERQATLAWPHFKTIFLLPKIFLNRAFPIYLSISSTSEGLQEGSSFRKQIKFPTEVGCWEAIRKWAPSGLAGNLPEERFYLPIEGNVLLTTHFKMDLSPIIPTSWGTAQRRTVTPEKVWFSQLKRREQSAKYRNRSWESFNQTAEPAADFEFPNEFALRPSGQLSGL